MRTKIPERARTASRTEGGRKTGFGKFIRSAGELPEGAVALIYGSGGRGRAFLRELKRLGGGRTAAGFIDTFKDGRFRGLPVSNVSKLPQILAGHPSGSACVVVASTFHRAIGKELENRGVMDYRVYLDADEAFPCACLPERSLLKALNASVHPLARPLQDTRALQGRVWRCTSLSALYMRPTGLSLCCWMPDLADAGDPEAAIGRMSRIKNMIAGAVDAGKCDFCASCPELLPMPAGRDQPAGFDLLHMDISTTCNLSCAYCNVKDTHAKCDYDPEALLAYLRGEGPLARPYSFDWGGFGEPAINPRFSSMTPAMLDDGASGLVYTNALVRHPAIERGLAEGKLMIRCSLDAGTRETYKAVRRVDAFETVWKNLRAYAAINPAGVTAKYIVTKDNAGPGEVEAFAERCAREGIRQVCISKDFYRKRTPAAVREGVRELALACHRHGLDYWFLPTAMSPSFIRSLKLGRQ